MSKRLGGIIDCKDKTSLWYLTGFPNGSNIGSPVSCREETYRDICMYGQTYSKSMDQPGKVASPARGQLNKKNEYFPVRVRA